MHALEVTRQILRKKPHNKSISAMEALVAVCPPEFLVQFSEWLKTVQGPDISLAELAAYFHCDVMMRNATCSKENLKPTLAPDIYERFEKIKKRMAQADKPSSLRKHTNHGTDPFQFDPIIQAAIDDLNKLFKSIGFVPKVT